MWTIRPAGNRYQLFDEDEQRTLEGVSFVRRDRAERVRRELNANDFDGVASDVAVSKMRARGEP